MSGRATSPAMDLTDEVVYVHDGSPEGLLSCIFAAYARHEDPAEIVSEERFTPQLFQAALPIDTNETHATRVLTGIRNRLGSYTQRQVMKCTLSGRQDAGTVLYRFVRFALDGVDRRDCRTCRFKSTCARKSCKRLRMAPINDISHPRVKPFHAIITSVDNECEKIRQFARFQHLKDADREIWFARINPRDSVVALVLPHFIERFNVQPFILYDEVHRLAGLWDGTRKYLIEATDETLSLPPADAEEVLLQDAWKTFYRTLSIDARYNPELRRKLMPKRFWKNLTEMQPDAPALRKRL